MYTRRNFLSGVAASAVVSYLPASTPPPQPTCSFRAPIEVLKAANVQLHLTRAEEKELKKSEALDKAIQSLGKHFGPQSVQLALTRRFMWDRNKISVGFIGDVDPVFRSTINIAVNDWVSHSQIEWVFVDSGPSDIRIEIVADGRNWSLYGTDAIDHPPNDATVHFGTITPYSSKDDIYRVAVHEFGHVLGAIHEHQSPDAHISWNTEAVDKYYRGELGWDPIDIKANVLATFPDCTTLFTHFDPLSIMLYDYPAWLTTNGKAVAPNFTLSDLDKEGMSEIYHQARTSKANVKPCK